MQPEFSKTLLVHGKESSSKRTGCRAHVVEMLYIFEAMYYVVTLERVQRSLANSDGSYSVHLHLAAATVLGLPRLYPILGTSFSLLLSLPYHTFFSPCPVLSFPTLTLYPGTQRPTVPLMISRKTSPTLEESMCPNPTCQPYSSVVWLSTPCGLADFIPTLPKSLAHPELFFMETAFLDV